jgi:hypothetical protein
MNNFLVEFFAHSQICLLALEIARPQFLSYFAVNEETALNGLEI